MYINPFQPGEPLTPGTRVYLWSQQYWQAREFGTGTVVEKTKDYSDNSFEYNVRMDDGTVRSLNLIAPSEQQPDINSLMSFDPEAEQKPTQGS